MIRQFRFVHLGIVAAIAAATATSVGLIQAVGAAGGGTPSVFVPTAPCRLLDTRAGSDNVGTRNAPLQAGETATFAVWGTNGNCTIPVSATGIATNVTAVNPSAASYVTIFPADATPRPTASNLNVTAGGAPTPNQVTVGLSANGAINAFNNAGTVDLIVDIVGYYQPASTAAGAKGDQGDKGEPGPTCPDTGCTVIFSGFSAVRRFATSDYDNVDACLPIPTGESGRLALTLPVGATITGVTARYLDGVTGSTGQQTFRIYSSNILTSPTTSTIRSLTIPSVDANRLANVPMNVGNPPVSDSAVYWMLTMATGSGQALCGASVTYTF